MHGGAFTHPNQVLKEATIVMEDYQRLNMNESRQQMSTHAAGEVKWVQPLVNRVKINCDAAMDSVKKVIGLGIIARDEKGNFLVGKSIQQQMEVEPMVAKNSGCSLSSNSVSGGKFPKCDI